MTSQRNTPPATPWEALRRLLNCNKSQLAERLGVTTRTLHRWEKGEAGADAFSRASQLMIATLRAADQADTLAQWRINFDAIDTIGGRK